MAKTELAKTGKKVKHKVQDSEPVLKGTLISVFLLGAFLIVTWAGVYFLFLDRF
ncbi:cytochrome c oxidase subunit 2A [Neobacillus sp. SCS-31]|uniref:cytochrome c oxidase subunit 2A n=1 Tax=Neobacillus oceani TaxID=3115292 RepID=UPI00390593BD